MRKGRGLRKIVRFYRITEEEQKQNEELIEEITSGIIEKNPKESLKLLQSADIHKVKKRIFKSSAKRYAWYKELPNEEVIIDYFRDYSLEFSIALELYQKSKKLKRNRNPRNIEDIKKGKYICRNCKNPLTELYKQGYFCSEKCEKDFKSKISKKAKIKTTKNSRQCPKCKKFFKLSGFAKHFRSCMDIERNLDGIIIEPKAKEDYKELENKEPIKVSKNIPKYADDIIPHVNTSRYTKLNELSKLYREGNISDKEFFDFVGTDDKYLIKVCKHCKQFFFVHKSMRNAEVCSLHCYNEINKIEIIKDPEEEIYRICPKCKTIYKTKRKDNYRKCSACRDLDEFTQKEKEKKTKGRRSKTFNELLEMIDEAEEKTSIDVALENDTFNILGLQEGNKISSLYAAFYS